MGLFAEPADTAAARRLITMQRERQVGVVWTCCAICAVAIDQWQTNVIEDGSDRLPVEKTLDRYI